MKISESNGPIKAVEKEADTDLILKGLKRSFMSDASCHGNFFSLIQVNLANKDVYAKKKIC